MDTSPHIHQGVQVSHLMNKVILALCPALAFGFWQFGLPAILLTVVCVVAAILTEFICLKLHPQGQGDWLDGSALLTALLLVMSLPPHAPLWMGALGGFVAVVLGKHSYGGLGQNLFNPAMLARVMLLIAFPLEMTQWPDSMSQLTEPSWYLHVADSFTGATPLAEYGQSATSLIDSSLGYMRGCLGETSAILLLLGGLFLVFTKVIHWQLPLATLLGCLVPATLYGLFSPMALSPIDHLVSGALLFSAFFIITDPVTSPSSTRGHWFYGLLFGLLVWLIRSFANYPEGVAFAVLLCNSCNPLIEHYTRPTIYGHRTTTESEQ